MAQAAPASGLAAPVAAGTSAANIPLDGGGKRVLVRWVARSTGTLVALHLRIQANGSDCRLDGKTGYGLGDGGSWVVTTHPVLPDGRPDESETLATQRFRPCEAPLEVVDPRQGVARVAMRLRVERGEEYATVIRNDDADAAHNYTSPNFLYTKTGIIGANGRNERDPKAPDAYYGLDPRELVGYSRDGGGTWSLPGGPYGAPGGRNFLPTYLQEYSDGDITGQQFYYATAATTTPRTVVYPNIRKSWTIRELGAYTPGEGNGTLTLSVDGDTKASVDVHGMGMLRERIAPITVDPGHTVAITATGLTLQNIVADTAWGRLTSMHLKDRPWRVENEPNFSQAAPVYPLPAYGSAQAAQDPPSPPPMTPTTPVISTPVPPVPDPAPAPDGAAGAPSAGDPAASAPADPAPASPSPAPTPNPAPAPAPDPARTGSPTSSNTAGAPGAGRSTKKKTRAQRQREARRRKARARKRARARARRRAATHSRKLYITCSR